MILQKKMHEKWFYYKNECEMILRWNALEMILQKKCIFNAFLL